MKQAKPATKARYNAVYKTHNIRIMAINENDARKQVAAKGLPAPLQFIKVNGIETNSFKFSI